MVTLGGRKEQAVTNKPKAGQCPSTKSGLDLIQFEFCIFSAVKKFQFHTATSDYSHNSNSAAHPADQLPNVES